MLIYLYLPLCAGADPAMNWGDPSTWHTFWEHVLRTSYRSLELGEAVPPQIKLLFAVHFLGLWLRQFTPAVLLLLAGPGLAWWARRDRPLAMASLLLFAGNTVVLLGILHFAFTGDNQQRVVPYYLPAYAVTALWLGGGLSAGMEAWAARRGGKRTDEEGSEETNHSSVLGDGFSVIGIPDPDNRQPTTSGSSGSSLVPHPFRLAMASGLALLLPFLPLRTHWADNDRSQDWLAYDFNQAALAQVAPKALLMPSGDHRTFPLAYLIYVKGQRPDVLLGDIYGTLHLRLLREYRRVTGDKELRTQAEILTALIKKERRPIYYTLKGDFPNVPGYRVQPEGLWYRVVRAQSPRKSPRFTLPGPVRGLHPQRPVADEMNRALLVDYEFFRGLAAFERNQPQVGKAAFQQAVAWAEGDKEALNNLGSACAEYGLVERAAELYRTALAIYPDYRLAQENLAKLSQRGAEESPGAGETGPLRGPEPPTKPRISDLVPSTPELPGPAAAALGLGGHGSKP